MQRDGVRQVKRTNDGRRMTFDGHMGTGLTEDGRWRTEDGPKNGHMET